MNTTNYTTEVAILGAGPVGLTIANYLSKQGIQVMVVEQLDRLIDYPRAIGIDDESLRTIQSLGLVDQVLPHTTPNHAMRFLTPKGRCFADIQPLTRIWFLSSQCLYPAAGRSGAVKRLSAI